MYINNKYIFIAIFIELLFASYYTQAGNITTDGSMGAATTLTGPNYAITQDLGTTVGNNLFHSFGNFDLSQGDVATFTGANTIQNVISRVTGGSPSSIDGTIQSQVGNANFFFLNPAGVIFGPNAAVDVPAAFHVSTANELNFSDGAKYNLNTPKASLTAAPPEAFGFLGQTGDIVIEGSELSFRAGTDVSFTGGAVTSNGATLAVPQGSLRIYGQGDIIGTVPIQGDLPAGNGVISMDGGLWEVSGNGGGDIWISGGAVSITNEAEVYNDNYGSQHAVGNLRIDGNNLLIDNEALVTSDTFATGNAGNISINVKGEMQILNRSVIQSSSFAQGDAGNISIRSENLIIDDAGILSVAMPDSNGNAGDISLNIPGAIQVLKKATIATSTYSSGNSGNITITADRLTIDAYGDAGWGINSGTGENSTGDAGSIAINVIDAIKILNGGVISSPALGQGVAGSINVTTESLTIDGAGKVAGAGIMALSNSPENAGDIVLNIEGELQILNGAIISTTTYKSGTGGDIQIDAGRLILNGEGIYTAIMTGTAADSTGHSGSINIRIVGDMQVLNGGFISSETLGSGNAGDINITATEMQILNGGRIDSSTHAAGDANTINIDTGSLIIDGQDSSRDTTGINSYAGPVSSGDAGDINITATEMQILNGGISNSSFGEGDAGTVVVSAGGLISMSTGAITTTAETGHGGPITINAPAIVLDNSLITTSVLDAAGGDGGDITINGNYLAMNTGFIQANTAGAGASGGDIFINTDGVIVNGGLISVGGQTRETFIDNSGRNVIQAAAEAGVSGSVELRSPDVTAAAGLAAPTNQLATSGRLVGTECKARRRRGSLYLKGKGGLTPKVQKRSL